MADRVVWTDRQYSDVLYTKTTERDHRATLAVGLSPLGAIVALQHDRNAPHAGRGPRLNSSGTGNTSCTVPCPLITWGGWL